MIFQRDEMSVTVGIFAPVSKARSWGCCSRRRTEQTDRTAQAQTPSIKGVMKLRAAAKKDCLGRSRRRFIGSGVEAYNLTYVREDAMGILHESSGNEARQQGRQQENCQVQEANEEDSGDGRQGVDGGRRGRVDRHGRFEAPKGGLHAGTQAGRIHVQRIPYQDHRLRVYHRRRRGILQAVCGIYQGGVCGLFGGGAQVVRQDHNGA